MKRRSHTTPPWHITVEDRRLRIEDGGARKPRSSMLDPLSSTRFLSARIQRVHHYSFMMPGRAQILIERVGEHTVRHHRVTVIRARAGPDHVRVVGFL